MDYKDFDIEDFASDDFFVRWVLQPDTASSHFWLKWLKKHPEKSDIIEKARELILSVKYKYNYEPTEEDYLEVLEKIHQKQFSKWHKKAQFAKYLYLLKYAAVSSVLLAAIFMFNRIEFLNKSSEKEETKIEEHIKKVTKGQKLHLTLPDGSLVTINSESTFKYNSDFNATIREVYLQGEAFFEITKNDEKPFIVHLDDIDVEVLGTSFNVKENRAEQITQVAVTKGKVHVKDISDKKASSELLPGEGISYDATTNTFTKKDIDLAAITSWKDNIIYLDNVKFETVLYELEKWYGVTFIIDKGISVQGNYSGKFKDVVLEDVLNGLGFSSKLRYEIVNDTIWLNQK